MSFSAYLVGTFDKTADVNTSFQIINPTVEDLRLAAAFFDADEHCYGVMKAPLSPNQMWQISTDDKRLKDLPLHGVAKFISLDKQKDEVQLGIVGYQRHISVKPRKKEVEFSETVLASVPITYAADEFKRISDGCRTIDS
jgi:hypothetical protein